MIVYEIIFSIPPYLFSISRLNFLQITSIGVPQPNVKVIYQCIYTGICTSSLIADVSCAHDMNLRACRVNCMQYICL